MKGNPRVILVVGPTASGKSQFAQNLALQIRGEILNADSQQFYRGLDIGTGKIPLQERRVPHLLLDLCEPGQFMTAGEFARQAERAIHNLHSKNKIPIIVGGTGLYVRALLEGLDRLPPREPELRRRLQKELEEKGGVALHRRLKKVDPEGAKKISENDSGRLVRYLEIYFLTGVPPSRLMKKKRATRLRYSVETYWLTPPRDALRERIAMRVRAMIQTGWVGEIEALIQKGNDPRSWENKPIGYAELAEVLCGKKSLEAAICNIIQKTQQYAKRQETFFRGMLKNPAYLSDGCSIKIIPEFGS